MIISLTVQLYLLTKRVNIGTLHEQGSPIARRNSKICAFGAGRRRRVHVLRIHFRTRCDTGAYSALLASLFALLPITTSTYISLCIMPLAYTKPRTNRSCSDWSFSLRSYCTFDDSDDSDGTTQTSPSTSQPKLSEDAKLLASLDMSSRQDDAVYKPNPWSIAKVNAASRPAPVRNGEARGSKKADQEKPKKKPKGRIVDFLKKQADAAASSEPTGLKPGVPLPLPGRAGASSTHSQVQVSGSRDERAAMMAVVPKVVSMSSEALLSTPTRGFRASLSRPSSPLTAKGNALVLNKRPRFSDSPARSLTPSHTILGITQSRPSHAPLAHIPTEAAHIPAPPLAMDQNDASLSVTDLDPCENDSRAFYSSPPPLQKPSFTDFSGFANARGHGHTTHLSASTFASDTAPLRNYAAASFSPANRFSNEVPLEPYPQQQLPRSSHTASYMPFPDDRAFSSHQHSSPTHPTIARTPGSQNSIQTPRANRRAVFPALKSFSSPPAQLSVFARSAESRPSSAYVHQYKPRRAAAPQMPSEQFWQEEDVGWNDEQPVRGTSCSRDSMVPVLQDEYMQNRGEDMEYAATHEELSANVAASLPIPRVSQGSSARDRQPQEVPVIPQITKRTRPPRTPSPSPSPSPLPPPPSRRQTDAYTHSALADPITDPDAAWSTLPPKNKVKVPLGRASGRVKTSGKFRVPPSLVRALGTKKSDEEMREQAAAVKRRKVVLYRPPPRAPAAAQGPGTEVMVAKSSDDISSEQLSMETPAVTTAAEVEQMPEVGGQRADGGRKFATPRAPFDVAGVQMRYAGLRAGMKKRRHAASRVWDLLELPSCGVVYCDPIEGHVDLDRDRAYEIPVVSWPQSVRESSTGGISC
ncbi:hypothetical protein EVG20_g6491 [Dentipellis fragilis]|uniref:Uncharacterized protein n=1 Tax=Dentipellis fragilis TaxID=205917 RepID=A0A4Y9YMV5_9AGAM|nr:hypothetical protein EVG20_g6491 [Dentipellis fragilis]